MTTLRGFLRTGRVVLMSGVCAAAACSKDTAPSGGGHGDNAGNPASGGAGESSGARASGTGGVAGRAPRYDGGSSGAGGSTGGASGTRSASGGTLTGGGGDARAGTSANGGVSGAASGRTGSSGSSGGGQLGGRVGRGGAGTGGTATAAAGASGTATSGGSAGASGGPPLKIMAIGDSTTAATCWRAMLWQTLNSKHAGRFDFVGSHKTDAGCSPSNYDQDNEAYGSSLLSEAVSGLFANNRMCSPPAASGPCPKLEDFVTAFKTYTPDVALIHYGTNDVWNSVATNTIIAGFDDLVQGLRAANAGVRIFIAQIIPMNVTSTTCGGCSCPACTANIAALNASLASFAPAKSTAASPVTLVDQNTGFDAVADTRDGVHPNDSGSQKMAAKWDAVLEPLF